MKSKEKKYSTVINRVRTPSVLFNITNGGGFKFGTIAELWGVYRSGKTTFSLQTAEYLLQDYGPDARVVIIDAEASADAARLEDVFNLHPSNGEIETLEEDPRVFLHYIPTIEDAFNTVIRYVDDSTKNNTPTVIIVDSIATLKPKTDYDELQKALSKEGAIEVKYAGGMMLSPRLMCAKLTDLLAKMPKSNAVVLLINQATVNMDSYVGGYKSKGGYDFSQAATA